MGIIILPVRLYENENAHICITTMTGALYDSKNVSINLHVKGLKIGKLCTLDHVHIVSSKVYVDSEFASLNQLR